MAAWVWKKGVAAVLCSRVSVVAYEREREREATTVLHLRVSVVAWGREKGYCYAVLESEGGCMIYAQYAWDQVSSVGYFT